MRFEKIKEGCQDLIDMLCDFIYYLIAIPIFILILIICIVVFLIKSGIKYFIKPIKYIFGKLKKK